VGRSLQMKEEAAKVYTDLATATAFMRRRSWRQDARRSTGSRAEPPSPVPDVFRRHPAARAAHAVTREEKIVARAGTLAQTGEPCTPCSPARIAVPEITLSTGEKVSWTRRIREISRLPREGRSRRGLPRFWARYGDFKARCSTLNAHVESHVFTKT